MASPEVVTIPEETWLNITKQLKAVNERLEYLEAHHKTKDAVIQDLEKKNKEMEVKLTRVEDCTTRLKSLELAVESLDMKQGKLADDVATMQQFRGQELGSVELQRELYREVAVLSKQCQDMKSSCAKVERLTTLQTVLNKQLLNACKRNDLEHEVETIKTSLATLKRGMQDGIPKSHSTFSAGKRFAKPYGLRRTNEWTKIEECDLVMIPCPSFSQREVIFTAPERGAYAIYAELWQAGSGQLECALRGLRGISYFFGKTFGDETQTCGLAVLNLAKGESVWLVAKCSSGSAKVQEYWFSGWCIQ